MNSSKGLTELHAEVVRQINDLGLSHFPSALTLGSRTSSSILAFWPEDDDWREFLAMAGKAGCSVVYTSLDELTASEVTDAEDDVGESARSLSDHIGDPVRLTVAYAIGPVVHLWNREAPWRRAVDNEVARLEDEMGDHSDAILARAAKGDWSRKIAEDPRYYGASRAGEQIDAADTILRELAGIDAHHGHIVGSRLYSVAFELNEQALRLVEEVRARIEDLALAEVPEIISYLTSENPSWYEWTFRSRRPKAKRYVTDRYGMHIPGVVDEVARWGTKEQLAALLARADEEDWVAAILADSRCRAASSQEAQLAAITAFLREALAIPTDAALNPPAARAAVALVGLARKQGGTTFLRS